MPERDRQRRETAVVVYEAIEQRALLLRFVTRVAHYDERAQQYLQMLARAARAFHAAFDIGIKALARRKIRLRCEDRVGGFGGELPPGFRRLRLHDHRPALHRSRDVQRPAHRKILAFVVEHVQLRRIEEEAALRVLHEGVVGPAIPEAGDDVVELVRAAIALIVLHMFVAAEIQRGIGVRCGDEIPARAPFAQMIERCETPRDVKRLVERGRCRGDQANALGHGSERGQQREWLERRDQAARERRPAACRAISRTTRSMCRSRSWTRVSSAARSAMSTPPSSTPIGRSRRTSRFRRSASRRKKVTNNPYRNFIAVNAKDAQAPWVKALVASYQQANVASSILSVYRGATLPASEGAPQH